MRTRTACSCGGWCLGVVMALLAGPVGAEVKLPAVLSSHMVLQRDMPVPVWGTASPDEKITVTFREQTKTATADGKGNWLVKLDPLQLGEPATLTVAGKNTITLDDVLVGEVWVGSGQSNMDMGVHSYVQNDPALAKLSAGTYPKLRLIRAGEKGWSPATPENNDRFSALLFSFGVPLQKELDVPLGLLVGAVGGTPSGYWLSPAAYAADAACKQVVEKAAADYTAEKRQAQYQRELQAYEQLVAKLQADAAKAGKPVGRLPRKPELQPAPGQCRGTLGNLYASRIVPFQPFAIRGVLWDQGESGTAITAMDQYTLMGALIRGWRKEWGQGDFPFLYVQKPSGGGCAYDPADPVTNKAERFAPLPKAVPGDGQYRETHVRIQTYPQTAMVIASDLGSGTHPTNKAGYGARAARLALGMVYGKPIETSGPLYASHEVQDGKIRVRFTHVGQGLTHQHGEKLQGFAIAGEDRKFVWADAQIDGDSVVLSAAACPKPVAVRYAWSGTHPWANLFNRDGLPAVEFRTDSW